MTESTILIVEDDAAIRELVELYLYKKGYRVIIAENGEQALERLNAMNPDLVLLDIEMPGIDGFELCRRIRLTGTIPIIFVSSRRDIEDKVKGYELGGDDYITKPFHFVELELRIQTNIRHYQQLKQAAGRSEVLRYGRLKIHLNSHSFYLDGEPLTLAVKESQLLILLATHPNQILSTEQLYDQVWGLESTGNLETVKVHISNLRRKLESKPSDPKYIRTVRGFGYIFQI